MAASMNLPLSNHPLYEGHDVDDARQVLSRLFTETPVEPLDARSPFSMLVNGLKLPRSTLCCCEYRHGMVAGPLQPLNFHTIQLTRSGNTRFNINNRSFAGDPQSGVMLSADQQVKVHPGVPVQFGHSHGMRLCPPWPFCRRIPAPFRRESLANAQTRHWTL